MTVLSKEDYFVVSEDPQFLLDAHPDYDVEQLLDPGKIPPIPESSSICAFMTEVKSQGQAKTCTSFAVVACLEFLIGASLSEAMLTHNAERNFGDCSEGLAVASAFEAATNPGLVRDSVWHYDDGKICWTEDELPDLTDQELYSFGEYHRIFWRSGWDAFGDINTYISSDGRLHGLNSYSERIKIVLSEVQVPVAVSVACLQEPGNDGGWNSETGDIHDLPGIEDFKRWREVSGDYPETGWHVIAICGYDDAAQRFRFKNSWGTWGSHGYGTIPYRYVDLTARSAWFGLA